MGCVLSAVLSIGKKETGVDRWWTGGEQEARPCSGEHTVLRSAGHREHHVKFYCHLLAGLVGGAGRGYNTV